MNFCRISPGLFMTNSNQNPNRSEEVLNDRNHLNKYLYAFCGEDYTCERYNLGTKKWEKVEYEYPDNFHARYGIKTIAMWTLPEEYAKNN